MQNMDVMNISTLGDLIKFHREKKDFSLDQISSKTKIRIKQLISLEENKLNELPNRVYLVGFLKALSDELEMNFDIALEFLNESSPKENNYKENQPEVLPKRKEGRAHSFKFFEKASDKKVILTAIFIVSFAIITIGVSTYQNTVSQLANQDVEQTVVLSQAAVVSREVALPTLPKEEIVAAMPVAEVKEAPPVPTAPTAPPDPIIQQLTIKAKKGAAFLVYRIDQKNLVKVFLQQGKELELKGEQIRLDVGNVGALEFIRNGEPLTIDNSARNSTVHLVFPEEKNQHRR